MKFFTIFLILMVTLFASRKHYLVEIEDKNEIIDENEKNVLNHEENVLNHEEKNIEKNVFNHIEKNIDEGKKPRKVLYS